jgi:hypothetical protein
MAKAALSVVPAILPAKYPHQRLQGLQASAASSAAPNVSALAREFNVSRQTIRRWRAKGWQPPTHAAIEILAPDQHVASGHAPCRSMATVLIIVASGIAALALTINAQFGHWLGATPLAAVTFAAMAVAADLLAIVLPSAAGHLWHARHRLLAIAGWLVWSAAAALAIFASLGFVERNVSDTAAGRRAVVTAAVVTNDQRTSAIEAARVAANAATRAKDAECVRRGPMCRDREADERAALATLTSAIAVPITAAPAIGSEDPQVTASVRLAKWAGLAVGSDDVSNVRLILMIAIPNLAGLVLAFGLALRRRA